MGSNFQLSKWYLDCVTEDGAVFIGYSAQLNWGHLSINYSSILEHRDSTGAEVKTLLRKQSSPKKEKSLIFWSFPPLGIEGTWNALSAPTGQKLFESNQKEVEWQCYQPHSRTLIRTKQKPPLEGFGYAEHLTMTIQPWDLPLNELHWGRFLSETDSLVWIDWRGEMTKTLVFHNGVQVKNGVVNDNEILVDQGRILLTLEENCVLRKGMLISTVISKIPGLKKILPERILKTHECKWRSRGLLKKETVQSRGWAIHEIVKFG